jgi:tetratricopeptide (TPR) repeat protein
MGGNATFAGTTFQARVIAYIYVHLLAQSPLRWFVPRDDTPLAVSGETDGPGDDARVEFGSRHPAIEVQAKHGLTAGVKLQEVFQRMTDQTATGDSSEVVLAVDREGSSRKLYGTFAQDLERMRSGRTDGLKQDTREILTAFDANGYDRALLPRLRVVAMDIDLESHPEAKLALQLLGSTLENPDELAAAWALLVTDAGDICARRLRRTRKDLVELLAGAGIRLQPLAQDAPWHRQLDFSRALLEKRHSAAALSVLSQLEARLGQVPTGTKVDPSVRYRLKQQQAAALLQVGRGAESLESARQALDVDPNGSHALVTAIFAATSVGDLAQAEGFAARALGAHPENTDVWRAKAQLALAQNLPLPQPPPSVAESAEYRTMIAVLAMETADWGEALRITADLFADGVRSADVLFVRANALMSMVRTPAGSDDLERCQDAERLSSELIAAVDDAHPFAVKALVLRAAARRGLARDGEADADLAAARELKPDDPDVLRHAIRGRIAEDDLDAALELLRHPVVTEIPELLAMRAQLLAVRKDHAAARRDLDALLGLLSKDAASDSVRLDVVDVALALGDEQLASVILDAVTTEVSDGALYARARARLEFRRGNIEKAKLLYAEAVQRDGTLRHSYLAELGVELLRAKRPADAVQAFEDAGEDRLPPEALRYYGAALFEANELARLQALINAIAREQPLPDWALGLATDLAMRQEDVDSAIKHLRTLLETGAAEPRERIYLARLLLERGRSDDAEYHVDMLLAVPDLSAVDRMAAAQLLAQLDREAEALGLALRAFRDRPQDPRMHKALASLALFGSGHAAAVTRSGPDTHIRLRSPDGTSREYTVYADPPIDPLRGEMSVADAEAAGILDKAAGDPVVRNAGTWQEQVWTVEEVLPAVVHVVRDIAANYQERFPGEPFFIAQFKVGELDTVRSWAPIIGSLESKREHTEQVLALYREHRPPLGMVAEMLGTTVSDIMEWIRVDPSTTGQLVVEWSDAEGQTRSRQAVLSAEELVLTRSALDLAGHLGILDLLAEQFDLSAPQSLLDELEEELREAEQFVERGHTSLGSTGERLALSKLEPDDPTLVRQRDRLRDLLDWLGISAQIVTRPLETVPAVGSDEEQVRDHIGHASYDAAALAKHRQALLYADDIGLRRFVPVGDPHGSISTISLLHGLVERGVLAPSDRDQHLLALAERNVGLIAPSKELLEAALRRSGELGHQGVRKVFGLLAAPWLTALEAAQIVVQVVKAQISAPIQFATTSEIVLIGLDAMSSGWPARLCIQAMGEASSQLLLLLPHVRHEVLVASREFAALAFRSIGDLPPER